MPVSIAAFRISPSPMACRLVLVTMACVMASACSTFNKGSRNVVGIISPYKTEVVQGNFVSKEQKEALQIGVPRAQVKDILGSPLVTSVFHADRWEYVFTIRRQGQEPQQRKLTVFFKGDELAKVESDELISEDDFVTSLSANRRLGRVPLLEVPQSVLSEFGLSSFASKTAINAVDTAQTATNSVANNSYPPLEAGATPSAQPAREIREPRVLPSAVAPVAAPALAPAAVVSTAPAALSSAAPLAAASATSPAQAAQTAPAPAISADPAAALPPTDPEIIAFVNRWAADWQARNAAAYFSHYLPQFKGTSATRAEWEASRLMRIEGRSRISVVTSEIRARTVSPTEARLVFRQEYASDVFSEVGTKAMFLVKQNGRWMIEREFFTPSQ